MLAIVDMGDTVCFLCHYCAAQVFICVLTLAVIDARNTLLSCTLRNRLNYFVDLRLVGIRKGLNLHCMNWIAQITFVISLLVISLMSTKIL